MKKITTTIVFFLLVTVAMAQNANCSKIKQLIAEANQKGLAKEATGEKFQTADDFSANMASTTLDGATRCYVQDAQVAKMYVAEFATSDQSKVADAKLSAVADNIGNMLKTCLTNGFVYRTVTPSENVFKGYQFDGRGANINTRIMVMQIYNPGDKKQLVFLSIINDPN